MFRWVRTAPWRLVPDTRVVTEVVRGTGDPRARSAGRGVLGLVLAVVLAFVLVPVLIRMVMMAGGLMAVAMAPDTRDEAVSLGRRITAEHGHGPGQRQRREQPH